MSQAKPTNHRQLKQPKDSKDCLKIAGRPRVSQAKPTNHRKLKQPKDAKESKDCLKIAGRPRVLQAKPTNHRQLEHDLEDTAASSAPATWYQTACVYFQF